MISIANLTIPYIYNVSKREANLEIYNKLVASCDGFERKGKSMPYTSSNGYMFSQLNKDGEIGIRLPREAYDEFRNTYQASEFKSYGATMREYVTVPDEMLSDLETLKHYLELGFTYVNSLEPK